MAGTALLAAAVVSLTLFVVAFPLAYVRFRVDTDWGLATQSVAAWLLDQGRSLGVGLVMALLPAVAFYGLVRWTKAWWLWGWGIFTLLTVLLVFLYPLLIAPSSIGSPHSPTRDFGAGSRHSRPRQVSP